MINCVSTGNSGRLERERERERESVGHVSWEERSVINAWKREREREREGGRKEK